MPIDSSQNFTNPAPQTAPNDATGWANATSYGGNMQGANQATQRFQGLGAAAAQRQAYNQNYAGYQSLMDQANNSGRGGQTDAIGLLRSAANGQQPSAAENLGRNMIDNSIDASMATAAGARGGSLAQAAALQRAQNNAGAYRQQGTNALVAQRADEMARARDAYMQGTTALRSGDFQGAGIELGRDAQQIQNEQFQRQLNQTGQLGYETLGQNAQTAQMQSQGQQSAIAAQNWQNQTQLDQHATDRSTGVIGSAIGAVGGVLGALSDVRSKQDVVPLGATGAPQGYAAGRAGQAGYMFDAGPTVNGEQMAPGTADFTHAMGGDASLNGVGAGKGNDVDAFATPNAQTKPGFSFGGFLSKAFGRPQAGGAPAPQGQGGYAPPSPFLANAFGSDPNMKQNITQPGGTSMLGPGGGMNVMGSLKANSDFATSFMHQGGTQAGGMILSDARAKAEAYALGRAHQAYGEPWSYEPPADIKDDHPSGGQGVLPAGVQPGQRYDPSRPTPAMLREGMASPMAQANRSLEPSEYEYRPQYTPPDQAPGEKNVGPMAQNMAANPVAATAVKQDPSTGMLAIDRDKALKLAMGGIGSLQQQVDGLAAAVARKKAAAGGGK